jgi:hypothetical protein
VLARTQQLSMPNPVESTALASGFVIHDRTVVGTIIDDDGAISIVANGRVVDTRDAGTFHAYSYRDAWADVADDLVADGTGVVLHATPRGLAPVHLAQIAQHDAERAALATLAELPTSSRRAEVLEALAVLHADPALVDLVAQM